MVIVMIVFSIILQQIILANPVTPFRNLWGVGNILMYSSYIPSALGLALGIVGRIKDENKTPGLIGLVLGAVVLGMLLLDIPRLLVIIAGLMSSLAA